MTEQVKTVEGQETHKPEQENVPKERFDQVWARAKAAEDKLDAVKKSQEATDQKRLEDDKKFKELADGLKVKLTEAEIKTAAMGEMEVSISAYLEDETSGLTDEQKALIPEGAAHKRLAWIRQAKKAGIFATKEGPAKTFNGPIRSQVPADKPYLSLSPNDQALLKLPMWQYQEWKVFNKR